jgi:hypothetical protein
VARDEGFKVEGLSKVVRQLQQFGLDIDDLKDAFSAIAREGAEIASRHAPRKSGRLASDVRGNRAKSKASVIAGRKSVPYAGAQNYGWPKRGIKPTQFMQKADDEMRPRALARLEQEINKQAKKRGLA